MWALPEFRVLAVAGLLSAVGDQVARVALSVLVYDRTSSALLTALTYALTFLPAVVGGPLLAGLADRLPRRRLMVTVDLLRAGLVAAMAVPALPLPVLLVLLVVVNTLESPFDAARAALVPDVTGDRYLTALVTDRTLQQTAQVLGFAGSGLLLLVLRPSSALLVDAASFVASAALLRRWVRHRPAVEATLEGSVEGRDAPPAPGVRRRVRLRRAGADAALGWDAIWSHPATRRAVLLTWLVSAFAIVPEGLAAPWARQLHGGPVLVALLLAANPVGNVVSGLWAARWTRHRPERLLTPLAQLAVLPLAGCLLAPPAPVVLALVVLSGIGMTVSLLARTVFVAHVEDRVRGRAFAVAGTGLVVVQGLAVALAGAAASVVAPGVVVGAGGILGSVAVVVLLATTRSPATLPAAAMSGSAPPSDVPAPGRGPSPATPLDPARAGEPAGEPAGGR